MGDTEAETKLCNNCKKQISANNFVMHEMHCKRHISLCEHCNEPIPKNEMNVHFEETHAKIKCPKCETEVEKMHLEDHEENSCPKKPMHCVYCELELPKDGLDSHLEYCGTRTEQCPKCAQFIMLKDQMKHNDSNCSFPEVKPKSNQNEYDNLVNQYFGKTAAQAGNEAVFPSAENVFDGDIGPRRQANVRHISKVNKPKSDARTPKDDHESEYDRLLAMHLAQDLHQDDSLEDIVRSFGKPQSPVYPGVQNRYGRNSLTEDLVMIPCEFCGEQFDSDDLVQHQSGCSLDRISALLPQMTTANNAREVPMSQSGLVEPPSIINNLKAYSADDWLDDTAITGYDIPPQTADTGSDLFLPCEFCNELFPMDSLVQHQAMCDRMTMTPLPGTPPAERRPKPKKKNSFTNAQNLAADFPNLNSKRHQAPPTLFNTNLDSDDENVPQLNQNARAAHVPLLNQNARVAHVPQLNQNDRAAHNVPQLNQNARVAHVPQLNQNARVAHRVQKPKPAVNGAFEPNVTSPAREIRTTLKKYGVETPDRGDYFTRQGNISRQSGDSSTDSWLEPSSRNQKKQTGNSVRTRSTLNNLLTDNDEELSNDRVGHIGGAQPRRRIVNPVTRQKVAVNSSCTKGVAKVKTTAMARDVQKELSRYPAGATASHSSGSVLQPKNRTSRPGFDVRIRPSEADELSELVPGQRQRTRANNVFGASTSKNSTRQKTENR